MFSAGDTIYNVSGLAPGRGMFSFRTTVFMKQVGDGASNTIAMSERVRGNFGFGANAASQIRFQDGIRANVASMALNPASAGACLSYTNGPYKE